MTNIYFRIANSDRLTFGEPSEQANASEEVLVGCKCDVYSEDGTMLSGSESLASVSGSCTIIIRVYLDECDDDFETELKSWRDSHDKISEYSEKLGEDWQWEHEPFKEIFMEEELPDGRMIRLRLSNSAMMGYSGDDYVLFVGDAEAVECFE